MPALQGITPVIYAKNIKMLTHVLVITTCIIQVLFLSGCMFDPDTGVTVSDSTTYSVSGRVYTSDLKYLEGIYVSLFDSVNSIRSTVSITDTNGEFSITFPYIKQYYLCIDFFVPATLSTLYVSKRDTIRFDDNYFTYGFTKYYETTINGK
jgi:hypothetical protein